MSPSKEPGDFPFGTLLPRQNATKSTVEGEPAARAAWSDGLLMARLGPAERSAIQPLSGEADLQQSARLICAGVFTLASPK
jgi:hypothetical protein